METKVYVNTKEANEDIAEYFGNKDLVTVEELLDGIEDLLYDVKNLKEEIERIKQDVADNYEPIPYSRQVGISDGDFV